MVSWPVFSIPSADKRTLKVSHFHLVSATREIHVWFSLQASKYDVDQPWNSGYRSNVCYMYLLLLFSSWVLSDSSDSVDCSPPGPSVHGISQARILEWVAIFFSWGSSWARDQIHISCIGRWVLYYFPCSFSTYSVDFQCSLPLSHQGSPCYT